MCGVGGWGVKGGGRAGANNAPWSARPERQDWQASPQSHDISAHAHF